METDEATPWPPGEKANDDSHDDDESTSPTAEGSMNIHSTGPGAGSPSSKDPV